MIPFRLPKLLPAFLLSLAVCLFSSAATPTAGDLSRNTDVDRREVRHFAVLLEHYHYNRAAMKPGDHAQVIRDYMKDLDGQRLFFLGADRVEMEKRHGGAIFYNVRDLGSLDAAFEIFELYDKRVRARIDWVLQQLGKEFDLSTTDFYRLDRSKSDWPETSADADELWTRRLKFELGTEMLNKKTMEQAKENVRKRYERMLRNIGDIEPNDVAELFLTSYARLYDPHSNYWNSDSLEDFAIQMRLQLIGIGAVLSVEDDLCTIKEIMPGSPADLDGRLRPNDKILAVAQEDGEPVDIIGMKLRRIVNQIRGKKGSQVRLTVQPADDTTGSVRKEIVLTRNVVEINSSRAHAAVFDVPNEGAENTKIGVITLPTFYGGESEPGSGERTSCTKDVAELIEKLKEKQVSGIVLDLRRNGGGLLSEAIQLAGLFIDKGPVVQVRTIDGKVHVSNDEDPKVVYDGPLAVLVDRFSASASEIVAGALQNYGRAIVLGNSSTHGKGTVQNVIDMKEIIPRPPAKTGGTKLTIQKFYLPNGASTQRKGVVPDIVLPSWEDYLPQVGEADLPRALVWDEVPQTFFEGQPLSPFVATYLRDSSARRQKELPEFNFLNRRIDWLKTRFEQKLVSTNLDERMRQKDIDDATEKAYKEERKQLEKTASYVFEELRIVPKPPRSKKAPPKEDDPLAEEEEEELESYARLDVHLRESLRVLVDAIKLGRDPKLWGRNFSPLSFQSVRERTLLPDTTQTDPRPRAN